jgi:hypothetical protein
MTPINIHIHKKKEEKKGKCLFICIFCNYMHLDRHCIVDEEEVVEEKGLNRVPILWLLTLTMT